MLRSLALVAALLVLVACGAAESDDDKEWGAEAVDYFETLADAYTSNDLYGVLDFYTPDAFVTKWRGDLRGGATVRDLMLWNSGDLDQSIQSLHLSSSGAVHLVQWLTVDEMSAVVSEIEGNWIAAETVFDLASSLDRSLRASPDVLETYLSLYRDYARAWTDGDWNDFASLYADDVHVRDPLLSIDLEGIDAVFSRQQASDSSLETAQLSRIGGAPTDESDAIYVGPVEYGLDPGRAVGVFVVTDGGGCERQVAVLMETKDGRIVNETRYQEVESFRRCQQAPLPEGWWTGTSLPPHRDEVVTGTIRTPQGRVIEVHNGTQLLEDLVRTGLSRFADTEIGEPQFDELTFEPSRKCNDRSGRLIQRDGVRELFLCFYESDLCPGSGPCAEPALSVRLSVLHELAHAWILDYVDDEAQSSLLEFKSLETWDGEHVDWPERGVEYAAEVIAWGLLEEPIPMARIGRPACQELTDAFELLTGVEPRDRQIDCD